MALMTKENGIKQYTLTDTDKLLQSVKVSKTNIDNHKS